MARRRPPRKVTYFDPVWPRRQAVAVPPRLARNTVIETTFDVVRRFRCIMRVGCGRIDPGTVIRPVLGKWQPCPRAPR